MLKHEPVSWRRKHTQFFVSISTSNKHPGSILRRAKQNTTGTRARLFVSVFLLGLVLVSPILRGSEMSQPAQPSAMPHPQGTSPVPRDFHVGSPYLSLPFPSHPRPFRPALLRTSSGSRLTDSLTAHQDWQEEVRQQQVSLVQESQVT